MTATTVLLTMSSRTCLWLLVFAASQKVVSSQFDRAGWHHRRRQILTFASRSPRSWARPRFRLCLALHLSMESQGLRCSRRCWPLCLVPEPRSIIEKFTTASKALPLLCYGKVSAMRTRPTRWSQLAFLKSHLRDPLADYVSTSRMQQASKQDWADLWYQTPVKTGFAFSGMG